MKIFGDLLRQLRTDANITLAGLAAQMKKLGVEISPASLHNLETGKTQKRPSVDNVKALALSLGLSPMQTQSLLEAAGYPVVPETFQDRALSAVKQALRAANPDDAEAFIRQVTALSDRFTRSLAAREDDVRFAIIPIAGWQARALAPEIVERSLGPALHEAAGAGIHDVTLVTAPGAASHWRLER